MGLPRRLVDGAAGRLPAWARDRDHVVVFAGHMVDRPDRPSPRFPPEMEEAVRSEIGAALDGLLAELDGEVTALGSAAAGADLLFREACESRGVPHLLCLPFPGPRFLDTSVRYAGDGWVRRFRAAVDRAAVGPLVPPEGYGTGEEGEDPHSRFNAWLLELARRLAPRVHLLALWDGVVGDGPGGTSDLVRRAREAGAEVTIVETGPLLRRLLKG